MVYEETEVVAFCSILCCGHKRPNRSRTEEHPFWLGLNVVFIYFYDYYSMLDAFFGALASCVSVCLRVKIMATGLCSEFRRVL